MEPADWLRSHLGSLALDRPLPSLSRGMAAVAGTLAAFGVIGLAGERLGESESNGLPTLLAVVLLAAAVFAMLRGTAPLRVAGVAAAGLAAPAFAFFLAAGDGNPSARAVTFTSVILLAVLYLVGPWRGHTFHLAALAVAVWAFALALTLPDVTGDFFFGGGFGSITDVGVASLLVGALFMAGAWWLDQQGLSGMATPFLLVGGIALPVGALIVVNDSSDVVGGLAAVVTGAAMCWVGAQGGIRRGTIWGGLAVAAAGVLAVVDGITPDDTVVLATLLLLLAAGGLVYAAPLVAEELREAIDPDEGGAGPIGEEPPGEGPPPLPPPDAPTQRFNI